MDEVTGNFLDELRRMPTETEWLEFKRAEQSFNFDHMAQYVSALANEANLYRREEGWLVMGIENKIDPSSGLRRNGFLDAVNFLHCLRKSGSRGRAHSRGCCCGAYRPRPGACRWPARAITGGAPGKN